MASFIDRLLVHRAIWSRCRQLTGDDRGGILVLFGLSMSVVFGFMALVWDIGRTTNVATDLQSFADHAALAAAAELDGEPGARSRAAAALNTLLFDRQAFAVGDVRLDGADLEPPVFYRSLPADDDAPLDDVAQSDAEAAFVEVAVRPHTVGNILADVLGVFSNSDPAAPAVGARAVAGSDRQVCDVSPLMFCAPGGANYQPVPGRMIHLKSEGRWVDGEFGLLVNEFELSGPCGFGQDPDPSPFFLRCMLALQQRRTRCFSSRGVDFVSARRSGSMAPGFNTRFDIYQGGLIFHLANPLFAPAPNVIKGIAPLFGQCIFNINDVLDLAGLGGGRASVPLPRDACFDDTGVCSTTGTRLGTGPDPAILDSYWAANHDTPRPEAATRFDLYQAEIAAPAANNRLLALPRLETGRPICFGAGLLPIGFGPERRVITAAAIDCGQASVPANGPVNDVPVLSFVELFLTEPVGIEGEGIAAIWAEEIGTVRPNGDSLLGTEIHDIVQLYR